MAADRDEGPETSSGRGGVSTRARWARRLGALGIALIAAAGLLEIGVRIFVGELPKFPRAVIGDQELGLRINLPNAHYRHKSADLSVWFQINGRGLRDTRELPYEKPIGRKRVVSLGDSFTIGYEVAAEDCFSSVIERELGARGHDVEVLNAGVSGYSNAEELLLLEREMLKYEPDVVLVSYYVNDTVDNVRTNLFRIQDGELVQTTESYLPLGRLWNFLNSNAILLWLSTHSDAFALIKERASRQMRQELVTDNLRSLDAAEEGVAHERKLPTKLRERLHIQRRLCGAIFERMYQVCHARGIPLIVQSIPNQRRNPKRLTDTFPHNYLDTEREGIWFVSARDLLMPHLKREQLYWTKSHGHWTAFSHEVSGTAIADLIHENGLLENDG